MSWLDDDDVKKRLQDRVNEIRKEQGKDKKKLPTGNWLEDVGTNLEDTAKGVAGFGKDFIDSAIDTGKKAVNTAAYVPLAVGQVIAEDMGQSDEDKKKGRENLANVLGNSFVSNDSATGKANPLEFGADFAQAGGEVAQYVAPFGAVGRGAGLAREIAGQAGVNAVAGGGQDILNQAEQGNGINLGETAQAALTGGALGAGASLLSPIARAIAGRRTGGKSTEATPVDNVAAAESPIVRGLSQESPEVLNRVNALVQADPSAADRISRMGDTEVSAFLNAVRNTVDEAKQPALGSGEPKLLEANNPTPNGVQGDNFTMGKPVDDVVLKEVNKLSKKIDSIAVGKTSATAEEARALVQQRQALLDDLDGRKSQVENADNAQGINGTTSDLEAAGGVPDEKMSIDPSLSDSGQGKRLNELMPDENSGNSQPTLEELAASAERPVGTSIEDFVAQRRGEKVKTANLDAEPQQSLVSAPIDESGNPVKPTTAAQELAKTIEEQKTGIPEGADLNDIDSDIVDKLTSKEVKDTPISNFTKGAGRKLQDPITYLSKRVGKEGADLGYGILKGAKAKSDNLNALKPTLDEINKLNKDLYGKSTTSKQIAGDRMIRALSDRENADQYLKSPEEKELFNKYQQIFDYVKDLREAAGLATREDYAPWQRIRAEAEDPLWLVDPFEGNQNNILKGEDVRSRFSKARTMTEMGDDVDTNLADNIYGYVNSQLNELAYMEPIAKFQEAQSGINAANRLNKQGMNEARDYIANMLRRAVRPEAESGAARFLDKLRGNAYRNILRGNVKIGLMNYTQRFAANSEVSKEARSLAGKLSKQQKDAALEGVGFGDRTLAGDLSGSENITGRKTPIGEVLDKIDPYTKSEARAVETPYLRGYSQGIMESKAYKGAINDGKSPTEAFDIAAKDPDAKAYAERKGNIVVNNTAFGANAFARPELLQERLGRSLKMFMRFPIGMSQHILEQLDQKSTRAVDMLRYGDPRGVPLTEMRDNYTALRNVMKDNLKAGEKVTGIPDDVLKEQVAKLDENVEIIDKEIKKMSQRRGGKSIANIAKMWAAAAAIQYMFDAGGNLLTGKEAGDNNTPVSAAAKSDPTIATSVLPGQNSKLAGLSSPLSPVNRYGQLTSRPVLNLIPGAGLANRLSGGSISNFIDDTIRGK